MDDILFDRVGKYLPYFYYSARTDILALTLASTAAWAYYGWDSTAFSSYGIGIHWSSIQTFAIFFYVLVVNLHVGGINSPKQLKDAIKQDLRSIAGEFYAIIKRDRKERWKVIREQYRAYPAVDGFRAVAFAFMFAAAGMFGFEVIWVFLYNYFQFGSLFWPVYYYGSVPFGLAFLNSIFLRNVLILGGGLFLGTVLLYLAFEGEGENVRRRFTVQWRFTRRWRLIGYAALASWVIWINWPQASFEVLPSMVINSGGIHWTDGLYHSTTWIFPRNIAFPQTEYTFYPSSVYLTVYNAKEIFGFYVNDWGVHLINLITKYLMFGFVCYPALVKVTK